MALQTSTAAIQIRFQGRVAVLPVAVCVTTWCVDVSNYTAVDIYIYIYIYIHTYIQGVPGGMDKTSGGVPYVELYRYNPKHLYPKLNGYGDNGLRKVWTSCISAYCTSTAVSH